MVSASAQQYIYKNYIHLLLLLGIMSIFGCIEPVEPSHPFDPDAPLAKRARSRVAIKIKFREEKFEGFPDGGSFEWMPLDRPKSLRRFTLNAPTHKIVEVPDEERTFIAELDKVIPGFYVIFPNFADYIVASHAETLVVDVGEDESIEVDIDLAPRQ